MPEMTPKVWKGIINLPRISNRFWQEFLTNISEITGNIGKMIFNRECRNRSHIDAVTLISYSSILFICRNVSMPRNALLIKGGLDKWNSAFKLDKEIFTC